MVTVRRVGTRRHVIDGAKRFRVDRDRRELTVWWADGTIGSYSEGTWVFADERRTCGGRASGEH